MNDKEAAQVFQNQQLYNDSLNQQLEEQRLKTLQVQNESSRNSFFNPERISDLAASQLNIEEELDKIFHLLSGHIIEVINGRENWVEPKDDRLKIFSDYGVKQIMNIIYFYINKNTLLSFYDEKTITWKVKDFGEELADLILTRYDKFFYYPTPEELYKKYKPIVIEKGMNITDFELYEKCLKWSIEELRSKVKHFPIIHKCIIDSIDSTYRRALGGKERESLRKMIHVAQSLSNQENPFNQQKLSIREKLMG